jgi:hypothetical protein
MSSLISISLKKADIINLPDTKGYIGLTASVDDKVGKFGHNVSVTVEQTKEQRDAKAPRVFVGNGKVVWTRDGTIKTAKDCAAEAPPEGASEPF